MRVSAAGVSVGVVCVLLLWRRALAWPAPDQEQDDVKEVSVSTPDVSTEPTPDCDCVCGQYGRGGKIVGGEEAQVHEFPWIVFLSYRGKFYCGGTLITSRHVLTAAHCTQQVSKQYITVSIGEHNRNSSLAEVQTRKVRRMSPHAQFRLATFNNDIAVLELDSPVRLSESARVACLPTSDSEDYSGQLATVAGWGRLAERMKTSESLQKVTVPILSQEECRGKGYPEKKISDNMICAGFQDGEKDACQGDSGGPLHAVVNNTTEVIGIVSWGRGCARPNFPGVYTRVARYVQWIDERLDGECRCSRRPSHGHGHHHSHRVPRVEEQLN